MQLEWTKVYAKVASGKEARCPACRSGSVRLRLIGELETRMGAGIIWCEDCLSAARLSRLLVPSHLPDTAP